jgi:hypothetical protein
MSDWMEQEAWCQAHREEIDKTLQIMWVFWLGCLGEPVVLAVIVYAFGAGLRESFTMDASFPLSLMRAILIFFAVLALVVSGLLRRFLLRSPLKHVGSSASTSLAYGALYRSKVMVPTVIANTPCLLGFVLFVLGDSPGVFTAFAVAAGLGLLWQRPRRDEFVAFCMQRENPGSAERE